MPGVVVANATFPHLREFAIQLAGAGLLDSYFSALAIDPSIARTIARIPTRQTRSLARQLALRSTPTQLEGVPVHSPGFVTESARLLANKLNRRIPLPLDQLDAPLIRLRNEKTSFAVGNLLQPGQSLLSSYTMSSASFQKAREIGAEPVLDFPTVHLDFMETTRRAAIESWPSWEHTWPVTNDLLVRDLVNVECDLANRIVVGSKFAERSFPTHLRPKVTVIPYTTTVASGLNLPPRPRLEQNIPIQLVFVGQMTLRKGLPVLLEALKHFSPSQARCILVGPIVGSCDWLDHLPKNVLYYGPLHRDKVVQLFESSTALALPSFAEGLPNVILEAMAVGLPVITTPTGGDEIVEDSKSGLIVPINDAASLVDAIVAMMVPDTLQSLNQGASRRYSEWRSSQFSIVDLFLETTEG